MSLSRLALRMLPRPDAAAVGAIRYGLGLSDEAPEAPPQAFAPLVARRQGRPPRALAERTMAMLFEVRAALAALHGAGIPVVLLKGVPMALFVYRDMAVRPMADADLLVTVERFPEARRVLEGLGYRPRLEDPRGLATAPGHVDHSVALRRPGGLEIDLHYFALDECRWPGADDGLWERSLERPVMGVPARTPGTTDMLLHLLAHGYRVHAGSPRWAADAAALLLDRPHEVDWDLLVRETRRRRMVLPLTATLRSLRDDLGLPVPAEPLARLDAAPVAAWEAFDFWVRAVAEGRSLRVFLALADYLRDAAGRGERPGLGGFHRYLVTRWAVPGGLAAEVARRAREVLEGRPARRPASGDGG